MILLSTSPIVHIHPCYVSAIKALSRTKRSVLSDSKGLGLLYVCSLAGLMHVALSLECIEHALYTMCNAALPLRRKGLAACELCAPCAPFHPKTTLEHLCHLIGFFDLLNSIQCLINSTLPLPGLKIPWTHPPYIRQVTRSPPDEPEPIPLYCIGQRMSACSNEFTLKIQFSWLCE